MSLQGSAQAERKPKPGLLQEDFPLQGACVSANFPANNTAMKGVALRLGTNASMLFDTDLLRMAAGWTGGTLTIEIADFKPVMQQSLKFNLKAADGTPITQEVMQTIHQIPGGAYASTP